MTFLLFLLQIVRLLVGSDLTFQASPYLTIASS